MQQVRHIELNKTIIIKKVFEGSSWKDHKLRERISFGKAVKKSLLGCEFQGISLDSYLVENIFLPEKLTRDALLFKISCFLRKCA